MSDSNRIQYAFIAEDTYGVKKTGSNLQIIRAVSDDIKLTNTFTGSEEIRTDRQLVDLKSTRHEVSGGLNVELSYGTYDAWLAAAVAASAWSSPVTVGPITTISFTATGTIADSGNGFGSIVANQWIKVSGASTAANNGYFKVLTAGAGSLTVADAIIATESAGASITIVMGAQIVDGTTLPTYNVEKQFVDVSNTFTLFKGIGIGAFSFELPSEGIVTGRFDMLGNAEESLAASAGSGTDAATTTLPIYDIHLQKILEGSTLASTTVHEWSIVYANNLRTNIEAGSKFVSNVKHGAIDVTGRFVRYFSDKTLYEKYIAGTESALASVFEDGVGNGYVFDLPRVVFSDGGRTTPGRNNDVMGDMAYTAIRHASEGIMCRIARFAA